MLQQQLVNGFVLGSTYALFALGFTLMFGVLGVINLTYGVYFAIGAFAALWASKAIALSVWIALPFGAVLAGCIAIVIDSLLLTRLRRTKAPELSSLMVTIGATLFLYTALSIVYGTEIRRFPRGFAPAGAYDVAGVRVVATQILIVFAAMLMAAALIWIVRGTKLGLAIRCVAENPDAAGLMGINGGFVTHLVSFISGSFGGAAGVLIGLNFNAIQPFMGENMMLRGFAVIVIGGLGDLRGALVAGLLLGVIEVLTAGYYTSAAKDLVAFALLVLTLWVRPAGLFGRVAAKRA
jgi:branched-chain amino acid transport system permease protein